MFLALDAATSCGWAFWKEGMAKPLAGTLDLSSIDGSLGRMGYNVHVKLRDLLTVHHVERIYFEAPIQSNHLQSTNAQSVAQLLTIASHIESFAFAKNIRCRQVPMGTWRRYFLGKGAGEKSTTFKQWARMRCAELGWRVANNDEADACGVLSYAVSLYPSITPPWHDALTFAEQFAPKPKRRKVFA